MYEHSRRVPNVDNISEYYYNLKYLKGLDKGIIEIVTTKFYYSSISITIIALN